MDEDKRWEYARLKVSELGSMPATFSCLIRSLRGEQQKNPPELGHISLSEVKRLLRSPAALVPMLAALLEFRPEAINQGMTPIQAITKGFKLEEISALVSCIYLNRQVKKRIDPGEWKFIIEILGPSVTIAGHLGSTISAIGFEKGIFTVCANVLGFAMFQPSKAKDYANYRRVLKKKNLYFDTATELQMFNCTGREICSLLAQSVAQSSSLASDYLSGLEAQAGERPSTGTQALNIWMKSLVSKGTAPQEAMDSKWYPNKAEVDHIEDFTRRIKAGADTKVYWLFKDGESINSVLKQFGELSGQNIVSESVESTDEDELA
jgi:hypothetical protein